MNSRRKPLAARKDPQKEAMAASAAPQSGSFDDLEREWLQDPKYRRLWEASAPKRAIAIALVRMRKQAGLTQSDVAQRAKWDKAFVSRLEGAGGAVPDTNTLARYAEACGRSVGLVFLDVEANQAQVIDAVTLATPAATAHPFERLRGDALTLQTPVAETES
jgi:transcriptional regulator with XRE-family HTH domain